jgi:hypothetical protein
MSRYDRGSGKVAKLFAAIAHPFPGRRPFDRLQRAPNSIDFGWQKAAESIFSKTLL